MKNIKNTLKISLLGLLCFAAYAGDDVIPAPIDEVLVNCTFRPTNALFANNPNEPGGKKFGLALVENGILYTNLFAPITIQKFSLIYSGQIRKVEEIRDGVYDLETSNKWRVVGHSTFSQCWRAFNPSDNGAFGSPNLNIASMTCNADLDGGDWGARDFIFRTGLADTTDGRATTRIKFGNRLLYAFTGRDAERVTVRNMRDSNLFAQDFLIIGCTNRDGNLVSPLKYNR